jgi:hypothetical protein
MPRLPYSVLLLLLVVGGAAADLCPSRGLQLLLLLPQLLLQLPSPCCCLLQCCCNASWRIRLAVDKPAGGYNTNRVRTIIQQTAKCISLAAAAAAVDPTGVVAVGGCRCSSSCRCIVCLERLWQLLLQQVQQGPVGVVADEGVASGC